MAQSGLETLDAYWEQYARISDPAARLAERMAPKVYTVPQKTAPSRL